MRLRRIAFSLLLSRQMGLRHSGRVGDPQHLEPQIIGRLDLGGGCDTSSHKWRISDALRGGLLSFPPCIVAWGFTPYASPTHCLFSIVIPPDGPAPSRPGRRPAGTGTSCSRHEVSPSLSLGCASEMRRIPALDYRAKQNLTFAFRKNRSPARFPRRNFASDPQSGATLISHYRCLWLMLVS